MQSLTRFEMTETEVRACSSVLNIIICDANLKIVNQIEKIIKGHILMEDLQNVNIELATTDPQEVLELFVPTDGTKIINKHSLKQRLLFLDINFSTESSHLDGLELAKKIRDYDIFSNIIFITNPFVSEREIIKTNVMPFGLLYKSLPKAELDKSTIDLLKTAHHRFHDSTPQRQMVKLPTERGKFRLIELDEIYYIRSNEVKDKSESQFQSLSVLSSAYGQEPLSRKVKIYEKAVPQLIRAGRSHLVNPSSVVFMHKTASKATLVMKNGFKISMDRTSFDKFVQACKEMENPHFL